ncbi:hypothetical protein FZEAL_2677 [Fusarium zealandicum]|uniref:BZIP domain-containing protein n=1 Tax=Fusarium zealandicum TaxID=1053134 RepID=A0A8H4UQB0_9HYPO|nr:hypothetical protein FZEAL_2677 [Fusarium zealandicum]
MPESEDDLSRRRERGRRSQAAFRKRQAQAIEELRQHNRLLKDGIQKVVNALSGDERPALIETISDLAVMTGLDTPRGTQHSPSLHPENGDITIDATIRDAVPPYENQVAALSRSASSFPAPTQRLNCTMWLDPLRYERFSLPPQDIIPYLGSGSNTLAGHIFWSVMEHAQGGCTNAHPDPSVLVRSGLGHSSPTQNVKASFIRAMVKARLEYRETGSISPENAAAGESDLGMALRDRVETDYRDRGKDPSMWLSCLAVEQRIRGVAGVSAFGMIENATMEAPESALGKLLDNAKCRLYDNNVCFGDGPRWSVSVVDRLFLSLINQAIAIHSRGQWGSNVD